jgi:hypothetical protein
MNISLLKYVYIYYREYYEDISHSMFITKKYIFDIDLMIFILYYKYLYIYLVSFVKFDSLGDLGLN